VGCSSPPAYPWPALEDLPLAQSRESTRLVLQHTPRSLSMINGHKAQSPQITLVEVQMWLSCCRAHRLSNPTRGRALRAACAKCRPCPCARHRLRSAGSVGGAAFPACPCHGGHQPALSHRVCASVVVVVVATDVVPSSESRHHRPYPSGGGREGGREGRLWLWRDAGTSWVGVRLTT